MKDDMDISEESLNAEQNQRVKVGRFSIKDFISSKVPFFKEKKERIVAYIILIASVVLIGLGVFLLNGYSIFGWNKKSLVVVDIQSKSNNTYVDVDEVFVVHTKNGSLDEVRKHIYVEPAVNYEIKEKRKNLYELTTHDLPSDTIINLNYVDNQVIEDKWAFQSTKDLKVNSVYPVDGSSGISIYSDIEIVFSYPDLEDINNSIEISPAVEGEFVQDGRVWVLHPATPLLLNTSYTITINNDIRRGDQTLKEAVQTTFSTRENKSTTTTTSSVSSTPLNYSSITIDNISTFRSVDPVMFRLNAAEETIEVAKVEVLKIKNADDFEKYLGKEYVDTKSLGEVPFHKASTGLYTIDKKFDVGYYAVNAYLENNDLYFSMPVQVSDLSVFLLSSQSDLLVWVGSDNTLLKDIPVTYEGKTVNTDKEGIATIENYNQLENQVKYVKVGKENPVYIGVSTSDRFQYVNGYVYTDRPLYKNTDEIQFWGYIPLKYYEEFDDFSAKDFVFSVGDVTVPIKVLEDGTFIGSYPLDNYKDGAITLKLSYKNQSIATRWIEVRQYEKENYDFSVNMERNYVEAGENFHFTVSVQHISGIMVPNKEIKASVDGVDYTAYTDSHGVATFDIPTTMGDYLYSWKYLKITSSLSEYASTGINMVYYVVNRFLSLSDTSYDKDTRIVTANLYHISTDNDKRILTSPYDLVDKNLPYSGTARVVIKETERSRFVDDHYYNAYTKKTIPLYSWSSLERIIQDENVSVKEGKIKYTVSYEEKTSTEDLYYSYDMVVYVTDRKGNEVIFNQFLFSTYVSPYETSVVGYSGGAGTGSISAEYSLYTYHFDMIGAQNYVWTNPDDKKVSVGEKITGSLYHYSGDQELANNPLLVVKYKNTILDKQIYTNQAEIEFPFTDDDRPGINIAGAYFKDGVFYRLPSRYSDYQEEDSKLDVEIVPDSTGYRPGQKVTVNIHVRQKGQGKKAKVNVSVVDEGVFKTVSDSTSLLSNLYSNRSYYQYLYSTYRDYDLYYHSSGGAGSTTGGGERTNFGDTIYFDMVETNKNGDAKVTFTLNDSVTSFRITAHAVTGNADAGVDYTNIMSSLPLSISFVEPRGLKQTDDVVINASSLGSTTDKVNFEFSIEGIEQSVIKEAFVGQTVYASFGKLPSGEYKVHIKAKSGSESDAVSFPIQVKNSQMEISIKNTFNISEKRQITPTKNPIILELYRDSFKNYEQFLNLIRDINEERLDTKISYMKALIYENRYLEEKNVVELGNVDLFKGDTGWKFLPAEAISYDLTAFVSYYDENLRFNKSIYYDMIQESQDFSGKLNGYVVLAAMKEPILDDLKLYEYSIENLESDQLNTYLLAYLFLGDYKKVREYLPLVSDEGVKTYLSTFVDKENAADNIKSLIASDISNRYLYFSIISYFENNNVELNTKEKVTVSYGKRSEVVELSSLGKKVLTIYQNDLKDLNINSKYKDISYNYYYEGSLDEIDASLRSQLISTSISNAYPSLGDTIFLNVDLSAVEKDTTLKIYLPNGLRLSNGFSSKVAYIQSNKIDYLSGRVFDKSENMLQIPLYAASPGSYTIEPIVIKNGDHYILSNTLDVNIQE